MNGIAIGKNIEYLEDPDGRTWITDISAHSSGWTVSEKDAIGLGYTRSAWWFRFTLDNPGTSLREMLLEIDYSRFEHIDLFIPDGRGGFASFPGGTDYHFSVRKFIDRNFVYRISLPPGKSVCYLRIRSGNPINFTLKAWSLREFMESRSREMPLIWMYYGLMLAMVIYNIFIFFATREWAYFNCSFFVLCYIATIFSVNGLGFQFVWPGSSWWELHNAYFFLCFGLVWLFQFIRLFLETKTSNPLFDRILIYSIIAPALPLAVLSLFLEGAASMQLKKAIQVWSIYYSLVTLSYLVYRTIKGSRQGAFVLSGFGVLIAGGIFFILKNFSILPVNFFTLWSWQIGSAMMIILFSLGLFDKFNVMKTSLQESQEELLANNRKLNAVNLEMEATMEELTASNEEFEAMNEELVQSQNQIVQSEKKFRSMVERFPLPVVVSRERDIDYLNESFVKKFGITKDEAPVVSRIISRLFPDEKDHSSFISELRQKTEGIRPGDVIDFDTKKVHGITGILDVDIKLTLVNDMTVMILNDITERKRMEEERERLTSLIEATSDFVSMSDTRENIIYINRHGKAMIGIDAHEDVKTKKIRDIVPEWAYQIMIRDGLPGAALSGIWTGETALLSRQGREIPVSQVIMSHRSTDGAIEYYSTIMRDMSEKKQAQELMVLTEKMTTVGGLAAGMAHEINNPLGVILQGVQMATLRLEATGEADTNEARSIGIDPAAVREYSRQRGVFRYLQAVREAGERAAMIVSNMLQFSRRTDSVTAVEDIHELIEKALNMALNDYSLKKKYDFRRITVVRNFDRSLPGVFCCGTEIEQVILNLLKNAAQAMSEKTGEDFAPAITIQTYRDDGKFAIEISDNGPGIPPEVMKRIFEPFYTTKKTGEGTGLGLSVSYYIVTNNHKGTISVSSQPGGGTVFTVMLPIQES